MKQFSPLICLPCILQYLSHLARLRQILRSAKMSYIEWTSSSNRMCVPVCVCVSGQGWNSTRKTRGNREFDVVCEGVHTVARPCQ